VSHDLLVGYCALPLWYVGHQGMPFLQTKMPVFYQLGKKFMYVAFCCTTIAVEGIELKYFL